MATQTRPGSSVLKRAFVGRAMASSRLEHTLLPKILALPVFSSDPMSSVAYATEEIMIVLLAASASGKSYVFPISIAIATLLAIVVVSYRQTVRAYPNGGGGLHRQQGEHRDGRRAGRGRGAPRRLRDDGRRLGRRRGLRDHVARRRAWRVPACGCPWGSCSSSPWRTCAGCASRAPCSRSPRTGSSRSSWSMIALGVVKCLGGCPAGDAIAAGSGGRDRGAGDLALRDPARVLLGLDRAHRGRGDLERRAGVPAPAGEERGRDPRGHGRDRDHDVPRDLLAGDAHRERHGERGADRRSRRSGTRCSAVGSASTSCRSSRPRS